MGDGIAREDGDDDGKKTEKESRGGVQRKGGTGGDSWRQDADEKKEEFRAEIKKAQEISLLDEIVQELAEAGKNVFNECVATHS